jgi:hypothetical protein
VDDIADQARRAVSQEHQDRAEDDAHSDHVLQRVPTNAHLIALRIEAAI